MLYISISIAISDTEGDIINPKIKVIVVGSVPAINHIIKSIINRGGIAVVAAVCDIKDIDETAEKCNPDCAVISDITAGNGFSVPHSLKEIPVVLVTNNREIINQPKSYGLFDAIKSSTGGSAGLVLFEKQLNASLESIYASRKKIPHINESYGASAKRPKDIVARQRFIDLSADDERAVSQQFIDMGAEGTAVKRQKPVQPEKQQSEPVAFNNGKIELIAIGASTGGTDAIIEVVRNLPENTPPVVIVQHMPEGFTKMYSDRLDRICRMSAKEAEDGDRLKRGLIIVAHGSRQMEVKKDAGGYYISSKPGEKVSGHCPSVDVLFRSVAKIAGEEAIGVILTGMGRDGAYGLGDMRRAGSFTIGQDEESCVVYGMPGVAFKEGAVVMQAPLKEIGSIIIDMIK